jgi:hypothetical protein
LGYPDITENPRTVIIGDYNSPAYSATKFTVGPTGSYSKIGIYNVQIDQSVTCSGMSSSITATTNFNVIVPHPCETATLSSSTISDIYATQTSFTQVLPTLANTIGSCGTQSVTIKDEYGLDQSSWITPGKDGSNNPQLTIDATNKNAGKYELEAHYYLDDYVLVTAVEKFNLYICAQVDPTNPGTQTFNLGDSSTVVNVAKFTFTPTECIAQYTVTPTVTVSPTAAFITIDDSSDPITATIATSAYADKGTYTITVA